MFRSKKIQDDDEPTAEAILARIQKIVLTEEETSPETENRVEKANGNTAATAPASDTKVILERSPESWDLLTLNESGGKEQPAAGEGAQSPDPAPAGDPAATQESAPEDASATQDAAPQAAVASDEAGPADVGEAGMMSEAAEVPVPVSREQDSHERTEPEPDAGAPDGDLEMMVHSLVDQAMASDDSGGNVDREAESALQSDEAAGAAPTQDQGSGEIMDDQQHQDVGETGASSGPLDLGGSQLEEQIRDSVRHVLQEWASTEMTKLVERILREEMTHLTEKYFQKRSEMAERTLSDA